MLKREKWWKNNTIIIKKYRRNGDYIRRLLRERRQRTYLGGRRRRVRERRSNAGAAAGGGAANGRDNPSRSLPRGPLIKIDPVNWGVWPTLARARRPRFTVFLPLFDPPTTGIGPNLFLVFVLSFSFLVFSTI